MKEPMIDPNFPSRPTAAEIAKEYTPERIMRLARFASARGRGHASGNGFAAYTEHQSLSNGELQEEAYSICLLAAYARIAQYNAGDVEISPKLSFYHWLLFAVRTDLRDELRRQRRSLKDRQIVPLHSGMADPLGDDETAQSDLRMDLESAIANLSPKQARVVRMYYYDGMTQVEIAEELGVSQPAVQKLLAAAKENLGTLLEIE